MIDCWTLKYLNNNHFEAPSNNFYLYNGVVGERNKTSPAAEKKRKQRLKMSEEKKDGLREKERLSKKAKHCTKTQEECAKCKNTNCECIMRK
jgi:hypothetical protein